MRYIGIIILLVLCLTLLLLTGCVKNTVKPETVYPQQWATGDGTAENPWANECLESAYTACPTGGTIYMRAGYYQLTGAWGISKAINIIGESMGKTIIVTDDAIGFYIISDYVTIKGFTIDAGAQTDDAGGEGVSLVGDYFVMEDIEIKDAGTYGLGITDSSYGSFQNIFIHGSYNCNVHIARVTLGKGNHNTYRNIYVWNSGNVGFGDGANPLSLQKTGNIYDNIQAWDNGGAGIGIAYQRSISVSNLYATGNGGWGIYLAEVEESTLQGAIVALNGIGYSIPAIYIEDCKNVNLTNVIATNNYTGIQLEDCSDIALTSCQFYDNREIPLQRFGLELMGSNTKIGLLNCKLSPNAFGEIYNPNGAVVTVITDKMLAKFQQLYGELDNFKAFQQSS